MTKTENREMWEARVTEFKASDQSATAWCAAQGLKIHQLRYWIRKFKSDEESTTNQTQWLSVKIGGLEAGKPQEALPVRVGKATIEVRPGFNPALLLDVIKTLSTL
jgi:hypothetical protein